LLLARRRWRAAALLGALAAACVASYFRGYVAPGSYHDMQFLLLSGQHAAAAARVIAGLSALPFGLAAATAPYAGGALLALAVAVAVAVRLTRIPLLVGALGVVGSVWLLSTALGRYDGTDVVLTISRYGWTALLVWAAVLAVPKPKTLQLACGTLAIVLGAASWWSAPRDIDRWRSTLETQRDAFLQGHMTATAGLFWSPEVLPGLVEQLRVWRYSLYRTSER
jgi:hypothetical protein